jgi:hypothetical protein
MAKAGQKLELSLTPLHFAELLVSLLALKYGKQHSFRRPAEEHRF